MSKLLDKLKKNSTIKLTETLTKSKVFDKKDMIPINVPALNIALSGDIDGGFQPGLIQWCGKSKHFKSLFSLIMAKSYLNKYDDSVLLFYDCEFGTPKEYFDSLQIDMDRVIHTPIMTIEELAFDIAKQLDNIERGDKIIIVIDSIGNLASKKEAEDAINGKSAVDMTRAKSLKSLFRIITPHLTIKDIPVIVVNHVYDTQEMFCLKGDTKIKTASGIKNIKDINIGEYVYALNGLQKVTHKYNPEDLPTENVNYMKLTFDDGSTVECTNTHKFLMMDGQWKRADEMSLNDIFK